MPSDEAPTSVFRGVAFCHVPADEPVDLEKLAHRDSEHDRWNDPGEPTAYFALDPAVALAELARHLQVGPDDPPVRRRLLGLRLDLDGLLDLRRPGVRAALGAPGDLREFADRGVARAVASRARAGADCRGLLVPSIAFLDDDARANLVLFADRLGAPLEDVVLEALEAGEVEVRPGAAGD